MSNRRALVVGADGFIGKSITADLRAAGTTVIETTRRNDAIGRERIVLDLGQPLADWKPPQDLDVAYICAAATNIKYCQENPDETKNINVTYMIELIKRLHSDHVFCLFLSTSRVVPVDGQPLPSDQYTQQKIAAERALLELEEEVAIVRLTKVFSPDTPMVRQWQQSLARGEVIHPFSDMTISPLSADFVVEALHRIAEKKMTGVTNLSGASAISYADMTRHMARRIGVSEELVQPTTCAAAGLGPDATAAASILETSRMQNELGLKAPDPLHEIDKTFAFQQAPKP